MALVHALKDCFLSPFDAAAHHDTVLWFDPDQEYAGLLDNLTDDPKVALCLLNLLPRLAVRSVGRGWECWEYNLANLERRVSWRS